MTSPTVSLILYLPKGGNENIGCDWMATIVTSIGLKGIEGYIVQIEVQLLPGVESVSIVGLPDASVKESKDRVMAALYANNCEVPDKKIVINLSLAEQKKNSPIFDLAMANGIMKENGDIKEFVPEGAAFLGMLPAIIAAKKEKTRHFFVGLTMLYANIVAEGER
ncbi:magnesium chelatase domain-containing protein [Virgibacillus sp. DJP39]|uniref:magnesium chelatase domain-containing protein n=1 Tax=Virgibacillus sp. DJP39 TaxID=3409790 RepID=UPI003BB568DF